MTGAITAQILAITTSADAARKVGFELGLDFDLNQQPRAVGCNCVESFAGEDQDPARYDPFTLHDATAFCRADRIRAGWQIGSASCRERV